MSQFYIYKYYVIFYITYVEWALSDKLSTEDHSFFLESDLGRLEYLSGEFKLFP